jgi:hypothetical protein
VKAKLSAQDCRRKEGNALKVKLPKELSGVKFPLALTIEMNDFDINLFLPVLFFTILAQGRGRAKRANDPTNIKGYIDALAQHPALQGFDTPAGRRVLEHLVRTTLITTGGVGRASRDEQITSIVPYTLLAHKAGFPVTSRQRGADTFLYQVLREKMHGVDDRLQKDIKDVFGRGVIIDNLPELGGRYDNRTELDTLTRLSIAFLDGFQNTRAGLSREKSIMPACPMLTDELATDLLQFLFGYYKLMPTQAFTYNLLALINFELFNYTLKLVYAINQLVYDSETLPDAMGDQLKPSPPQLYLDFTLDARGYSQEMAKACVHRDIEAYQQFLPSVLRLRLLDRYVEPLRNNASRRAKVDTILDGSTAGPLYLQRLLLLQNDPTLDVHIQARAQVDEELIRAANRLPEDGDEEETLDWLDEITDVAETDIDRVINLLAEGQRDEAIRHFISWYWGVGGMKKPHGVLAGTIRRYSWRYAPSNDLLGVFVQVAAARLSQQGLQPIRLREFLAFLEQRFGILIDRPPDVFKGSEYTAAARDNLRAMLGRLRQMGIFRDLSDDFTVQRLHPPYAGTETIRVEA